MGDPKQYRGYVRPSSHSHVATTCPHVGTADTRRRLADSERTLSLQRLHLRLLTVLEQSESSDGCPRSGCECSMHHRCRSWARGKQLAGGVVAAVGEASEPVQGQSEAGVSVPVPAGFQQAEAGAEPGVAACRVACFESLQRQLPPLWWCWSLGPSCLGMGGGWVTLRQPIHLERNKYATVLATPSN